MSSDTTSRTSDLVHGTELWRRLLIILLAIAVTVPVLMKSRPRGIESPGAAFSVASSATGYVRIAGDVRHPGIYPITANAMTDSVILLAEPVRKPQRYVPAGSELLPLRNGADLQVVIAHDGSTRIAVSALPTSQRLVLGIPLDINVMNKADFDRVPGIGPALARRIVAYRQMNGGFMAVQDLLFIEGIGQKKYLHLVKFFK
ncbi:MAG TPA: helix-hairpin-helix domain-containing protein [Desulfuromonadaceae bacterium]